MASTLDGHPLPQNEFDIRLSLGTSASSQAVQDYTRNNDYYQAIPPVSGAQSQRGERKETAETTAIATPLKSTNSATRNEPSKPKRVRTGCLTCRERHLKCDEALPRCQNCQKSDRLCKRGIRLNFIDTQVAAPPYSLRSTREWRVNFHDESRDIASEYVGGYERYPSPPKDTPETTSGGSHDLHRATTGSQHGLSSGTQLLSAFPPHTQPEIQGQLFQNVQETPTPSSTFLEHTLQRSPFGTSKSTMGTSNKTRPYLNTPEEVLLMQVFVEEVGLWMDSMDAMKHFTHILPFHALSHPMLLHAFMACGARHLYLVNPSYGEEKALYYYNISTQALLSSLQNPSRDTVLCATTAVVLNVYEIMCEKAMQRMNHIAGARALIKECRWNAKSTGIGGACFWLNVGMELLSCLHFNWRMAWEPDEWGIDMNMAASMGQITGNEELWTHRMLYICAKIANFRATVPQFQRLDRATQESRLAQRCEEWNNLKAWCDEWARCVPRSMQPLGYLQPWQTNSKSAFPEVWLVKRSAIVGRLFYHTACCLLAKIHPTESAFSESMVAVQQSHAHDICGIVAHVKDRGVASVSLRCLAIAAECLVNRQAQEEVLQILDKVIKETGWQVAFLQQELMEHWGWNTSAIQVSQQEQQQLPPIATTAPSDLGSSVLNSPYLSTDPMSRPRLPQGIVNPLMATADFSAENHVYQNHYVAPQNNHPGGYQYESYQS
ncbi:hypothetical protein VTO42DRAFT_3017 [Malbranchea cinnamomea]